MDAFRRRGAALSSALVFLLLGLQWAPIELVRAQALSDALQALSAAVAGIACLVTGLRRGPLPFWLTLAAGLFCWCAAQIMFGLTGAGLTNDRPVELWEHLFLVSSLVIGLAPAMRPDRRAFGRGGVWLDVTILLCLSLYFYASNTIDLVSARTVAEYYEDTPTIAAAALPIYLWLLSTGGGTAWRAIYADLFLGLGIWYGGQTVSGLALAWGTYTPGLYDLPWTLSFLWIAVAAWRGLRVPADAPPALDEPTRARTEWRLARGGLLAALPSMVLMALWSVDARLFGPGAALPDLLKAWMAAVMATLIGSLFLARLLVMLRRVEQTEAQRAESLRLLFTSNPHPAWLVAADGRVLEVGDRACTAYGYSREEFGRMGLADLEQPPPGAPPPPLPAAGCVWHWTREGARREVELDTQPIGWRGEACRLATAIDLTDRHAADRERSALVEELRQSQKMEAIGRLAGGVAHDFNNILTAIIGYASLAADHAKTNPELAASIQEIQLGAERAAGLTAQLLAFSRKQVLQPRVLDLNAAVASMEGLLQRVLGEHILIAVEFGAAVWPIKADPTQLGQVVLNLAVNARDAMPHGGTLCIVTRNVEAGMAPPEAGSGRFVELLVRDSGVGMSEDVRARIFEPFFTTKGSQGTGLGLATAYGIVTQSGGAILCDSRPGDGATFRVFFPRTEETAASGAVSGARVAAGAGRGRILLVEDDQRVRGLAAQVLQREGYLVDAALPNQALEVHARGTPPDLLLSDVVMPIMSGPEVARLLRTRQPGLRVLFVSGYADHFATELTGSAVRDPVLNKPFTPDQLLSAVREALAS